MAVKHSEATGSTAGEEVDQDVSECGSLSSPSPLSSPTHPYLPLSHLVNAPALLGEGGDAIPSGSSTVPSPLPPLRQEPSPLMVVSEGALSDPTAGLEQGQHLRTQISK